MVKNKEEIGFKWSWKTFIIIILVIWLFLIGYSYTLLEDEYKNYQQEVQKELYEYQLNLTRALSEVQLNLTTELSKYDCYEKGTAYCYDKPQSTCGEGNTAYCVRDDYNVGYCLSNERV